MLVHTTCPDNKLAAKYAATLGSWDGKGEALFALQQHDKLVKGDRDALQRAFLRVEMGDKTVRLRVFLWANDVDRTPPGETVKGSNGLYCVYGGKTPGTLWHAPRSCKALCDPCKRLEPDQCESRPAELLEWGQPRQIVRAFEGGSPSSMCRSLAKTRSRQWSSRGSRTSQRWSRSRASTDCLDL